MGAVNRDAHPAQVEALGHRGLAELDIAPGRVDHPQYLADLPRLHRRNRLLQLRLDGQLDLIGQLGAGGGKELDAIVVEGVVGGADDDTGHRGLGAGHQGDRRRRHGPQQLDVDTRRHQARLQRRLEHIAGNAGILADDDRATTLAAGLPGKYPTAGPAQFQHEIRGDRRLTHQAANTVCSKIALAH